jgi:hypothetical protein
MAGSMAAAFLICLAIAASDGTDAHALVARLGSTRFSEREAAMKVLEELGKEAVPALLAARHSSDPEVRTRVESLLGRLEWNTAFSARERTLDLDNRPLREVADAVAAGTGTRLALPKGENQARPVTLRARERVGFWRALDQVCAAGAVQVAYTSELPHEPDRLLLAPGKSDAPPLTSDHGPFRLVLLGVNRSRGFLGADLLLLAEGRIRLSPGEIELHEAIDDRGQSLLAGAHVARLLPSHCGFGYEPSSVLPAFLYLPLPHAPGKTIRLRGSVVLPVAGRRSAPAATWPIAAAAGKRTRSGPVQIEVEDCAARDDRHAAVRLALTFPASGGNLDVDPSQWEVVDAVGRAYVRSSGVLVRSGPQGTIELQFTAPESAGAPCELRYYDLIRTRMELPFAFGGISIP